MKKIISFLFTCVIALCALVGCGGGDKGSSLLGYYQCLRVVNSDDVITEGIEVNITIYDSRNIKFAHRYNDTLNTLYTVKGNTITFEEPHASQGNDIPAPIDGTINGNQMTINFEGGTVCLFEKVYGKYDLDLVTLNGEDMFSTYAYFYIELTSSPSGFKRDGQEKLTIVYKKLSGVEVREEYKFDVTNGSSMRVLYEDSTGELKVKDFTFHGNIIKIDFDIPSGRIQATFIKKVFFE